MWYNTFAKCSNVTAFRQKATGFFQDEHHMNTQRFPSAGVSTSMSKRPYKNKLGAERRSLAMFCCTTIMEKVKVICVLVPNSRY